MMGKRITGKEIPLVALALVLVEVEKLSAPVGVGERSGFEWKLFFFSLRVRVDIFYFAGSLFFFVEAMKSC
jgi:hypothetical protein